MTRWFRYPGDPPLLATELTGGAFLAQERAAGRSRDVTILSIGRDGARIEEVFPMGDTVVCDQCAAPILPDDRCTLVQRRLYCASCTRECITPWLGDPV